MLSLLFDTISLLYEHDLTLCVSVGYHRHRVLLFDLRRGDGLRHSAESGGRWASVMRSDRASPGASSASREASLQQRRSGSSGAAAAAAGAVHRLGRGLIRALLAPRGPRSPLSSSGKAREPLLSLLCVRLQLSPHHLCCSCVVSALAVGVKRGERESMAAQLCSRPCQPPLPQPR